MDNLTLVQLGLVVGVVIALGAYLLAVRGANQGKS
jgi:hypothetical protein